MDIKAILESNNIDFVEQGKNVAVGNVYVKCPWCDDPSHHMGIHLVTGKWGCWRNPQHRGKDLARLLAAILHISRDSAAKLVTSTPEPDGLDAAIDRLNAPQHPISTAPGAVGTVWGRWTRLIRGSPSPDPVTHRFYLYLASRGFMEVSRLSEYFDLRAAISGRFNRRILFPIRSIDGLLVGWTGRAISPSAIKYLSFPAGPAVKHNLLFHDMLARREDGIDKLIITEGPFDALKLYSAGRDLGWGATCIFGRVSTVTQETQLLALGKRFSKVLVAFDADAWDGTLRLSSTLASIGAEPVLLPTADPGSMPFHKAQQFLESHT